MAAAGSDTPRAPTEAEIVRIAARAYEQDRYLAALFAPAATRADLMTLAAFAGEVGRIPSMVSEPMAGEIRLQWWRDVLDHDVPCSTGHPVADALGELARRRRLPRALIERHIDAVGDRLAVQPFADEAALLAHLAASEGSLFTLAGLIVAPEAAFTAGAVYDRAGESYGLARLMIELAPRHAEGRCLVPRDLLARHGLDAARLHEAEASALSAMLGALGRSARERLALARVAQTSQPRAILSALLPLAMVEPYLRVCERVRDPFRQPADVLPLSRLWRLWRASMLGGF